MTETLGLPCFVNSGIRLFCSDRAVRYPLAGLTRHYSPDEDDRTSRTRVVGFDVPWWSLCVLPGSILSVAVPSAAGDLLRVAHGL